MSSAVPWRLQSRLGHDVRSMYQVQTLQEAIQMISNRSLRLCYIPDRLAPKQTECQIIQSGKHLRRRPSACAHRILLQAAVAAAVQAGLSAQWRRTAANKRAASSTLEGALVTP